MYRDREERCEISYRSYKKYDSNVSSSRGFGVESSFGERSNWSGRSNDLTGKPYSCKEYYQASRRYTDSYDRHVSDEVSSGVDRSFGRQINYSTGRGSSDLIRKQLDRPDRYQTARASDGFYDIHASDAGSFAADSSVRGRRNYSRGNSDSTRRHYSIKDYYQAPQRSGDFYEKEVLDKVPLNAASSLRGRRNYSRGSSDFTKHDGPTRDGIDFKREETVSYRGSRYRGSSMRGKPKMYHDRHRGGLSSTDHPTEINYVALEVYLTIKDVTFCKGRKILRHKIMPQSTYFPDIDEEIDELAMNMEESLSSGPSQIKNNQQSTSLTPISAKDNSNEGDASGLAAYNSFLSPDCLSDLTVSPSANSMNQGCSEWNSFPDSSLEVDSDNSDEEEAKAYRRLLNSIGNRLSEDGGTQVQNVEEHLLSSVINKKLNESSDARFVILIERNVF